MYSVCHYSGDAPSLHYAAKQHYTCSEFNVDVCMAAVHGVSKSSYTELGMSLLVENARLSTLKPATVSPGNIIWTRTFMLSTISLRGHIPIALDDTQAASS